MLKAENVATPLMALTAVAPKRAPPPGPPPSVSVTTPLADVTTSPDGSSIATATAGLIGVPAVTLLGWTVKMSRVGAGGPFVSVQARRMIAPAPIQRLRSRRVIKSLPNYSLNLSYR